MSLISFDNTDLPRLYSDTLILPINIFFFREDSIKTVWWPYFYIFSLKPS